mmetsp:Transcript_36611/g.96652  ORF Transcript_36611/g.96652 Transcript_36611/m.96652 type:complete len:262 (+) Transcript_36611:53-838(+)
MLAINSCTLAFAPVAPVAAPVATRAVAPQMGFGKAELMELAKQQNPVLGYYDPIGLADVDLWGQGEEASIAWLRHAEIKHGRVAMAAFVGFMAAANYETIGAPMASGMYPALPSGLTAPEVWDSIPFLAKLQIIGAIGVFEHISEDKNFLAADGKTHYMRGGKPGYMPTFDQLPHPVPFNLFDPFGFSKNASPEKKAKGLLAEINNGRLAMIGIFGFVSASCVPGSVPALDGVIPYYSGDIMAPFLPAGPMESMWTIGKMW